MISGNTKRTVSASPCVFSDHINKRSRSHEHEQLRSVRPQSQPLHRLHGAAVCAPLRQRQLLLPGPHSGGHPRVQPNRGPVHRLQILPEEVKETRHSFRLCRCNVSNMVFFHAERPTNGDPFVGRFARRRITCPCSSERRLRRS